MGAFDPQAAPFWEQARGGGPISAWMDSREEAEDHFAARRERLRNPLLHVYDGAKPRTGDGLTYKERRAMGLCTMGCGAESRAVRCPKCAEAYYLVRNKRRREFGK